MSGSNTSILEIDVRDEKFKAFQEDFDKYQAALGKLPGAWGATDDAVALTGADVMAMTAALMAQNEILHQSQAAQTGISKAVKESDRGMKSLVDNTKHMAANIKGATESLLKWASVTGVISGLVGAGGLFGIDRMALGVAGNRRAAQGLGVSSGDQRAFDLNFNRYFDANSLLGNIADAKSDQSKRWAFGAMGIHDQDQKDPVALGVEVATRAKEVFDRGDGSQQYAQAHGLLQFYTMDELRRLHATSMEDLRKSGAAFNADAKTLALSDPDQKAWQDFSIQVDRFGMSLETVVIRDLTPLTPALTHLSAAFTTAVDAFLGNPHLKEWISDLATQIDKFATYLGSDAVQADFANAIDKVAEFASAIERAVNWILGFLPSSPNGDTTPGAQGGSVQNDGKQSSILTRRFPGLIPAPADALPGTGSNPFNLKFANQPGAVEGRSATDGGHFAQFKSQADAVAADLRQWMAYQDKDGLRTIGEMIHKATPGAPANYAPDVAAGLGLQPNDPVNLHDPETARKFLAGIAKNEGNAKSLDDASVRAGIAQALGGGNAKPNPEPTNQDGGADLKQWLTYQDRDHLRTIADLIHKAKPDAPVNFAPDVAAALGKQPSDAVDLHDPGTATKFLAEVAKEEGKIGNAAKAFDPASTGPGPIAGTVNPALGLPDDQPAPREAAAFDIAAGHLEQRPREINAFLKSNGGDIDAAKTAWCAAFVNAALSSVGITGSGSDVATSFEKWGQSVGLSDVHKGDILVEARGHAPGQVGGHVGFASGRTRMLAGRDQVEMVSGNEGGKVSRTWEDAEGLDIRRAMQAAIGRRPDPPDTGTSTGGRTPPVPSIARNAPEMRGAPAMRIEIHNNTGGSAVVTASQLPQ